MTFLRSILPIATWAGVVAASIFQLTIFDTDSTLNGQAVNAAGGAFYLGLSEPSSYCPSGTTQCPEVTTTLFAGMDALWVEVPGGQQVYVTSSGAISFTPAHSETLPPDVAQGAFTNITVVSDCAAPLAIFNWENSVTPATGGILACPQTVQGSANPTYQVYAKTPAFSLTNCTEVLGLLPHLNSSGDYGAWQYE